MGTFTIHSIGDAAFLEQILISIAMMFGTADLSKLVSIGMLFGVTYAVIASMMKGSRELPFQDVLIGWVLYACFFAVPSTVVIEDAYTGEARVTSNVPLGIGFAGGVISNLGYGLSKLFNQGFTVISPNAADSRYNESLKVLNDVRRQTYDSQLFFAMNNALGGGAVDVRKSLYNYISECTLTKIDLGVSTIDDMMTQPITQALRFDSEVFGTHLYLDSGSSAGAPFTCTEGWAKLDTAVQFNSPIVIGALNNILNIHPATSLQNAFEKVESSLFALDQTAIQASDYLKVALLEPLYYEAAAGRYQDFQDFGSALMVNEAIQQRNTQWAAEQTLFMTVVRPLMTFFEGLVFAITPMMAFLVVIGSFGLKLAGKYMLMLFWMQLWMPMLAIINMFIHMSASGEMSSMGMGIDSASMYALSRHGEIMSNWIATGGMLAAATPVISLFIVTGSTFAMTNIASRMGGQDHINEKVQSQDIVKQGAYMESGARYNHDQFSGTGMHGAEGMLSNLSLGQSLGAATSSASTAQSQKSMAFQQALGRGFSEGVSQEQMYSQLQSVGQMTSSLDSKSQQFVNSQAKEFMEAHGLSSQHDNAVKGAFTLGATGAVDVNKALGAVLGKTPIGAAAKAAGGAGVKAELGISGKASSETSDSRTESATDSASFKQAASRAGVDSQSLTEQLAHQVSQSGGETFAKSWGDTASETLTSSASELVSASETYSSLSQLQSQVGAMTQTDFKTLAGELSQSPDAMRYLNEQVNMSGGSVQREAADLYQRYHHGYGMRQDVALAAAQMTALTNTSNFEGNETKGFGAVMNAVNMASGRNLGVDADAHSNRHLNDNNFGAGNVKDTVNKGVGSGPLLPDSFRTETDARSTQDPGSRSAIVEHHDVNKAAQEGRIQSGDREASSAAVRSAEHRIMDNTPDKGWAAAALGSIDNGMDWLDRRVEQQAGGLMAGGRAAGESISESMEQLRSMTPEQLNEIRAATDSDAAPQGLTGAVKDLWVAGMQTQIGAVATGISMLRGGEDLSEAAKDMSLRERGAFYTGALSEAISNGAEARTEFMERYGEDFKATMQAIGMHEHHLTPAQAAIYAESFDFNQDRMDSAVQTLKMDYAERNEDGSVQYHEDGRPVLSAHNERLTDQMAGLIQSSTTAGEQAGSYLAPIRAYNIANRSL